MSAQHLRGPSSAYPDPVAISIMAKKLSVCNNASAASESPNSCISQDFTMLQGEVCSSKLEPAALEPPFLKDADKQHLDDEGYGNEKSLRAKCIKLFIMLVFMVAAAVAVLAPEGPPVLLSSLHSHIFLLSTELRDYAPRVFEDFHGIWEKLRIPGSQIHLALVGTVAVTVIGLIVLSLKYFRRFIRRSPNKPIVSGPPAVEVVHDVKAETPSESGSSERISLEKTPCSEEQDLPSSPLEDSPMSWKPISKPEVSLMFEYDYSPSEMSTSEKQMTHVQSFLTRDDTVQRPERRSRRRSMMSTVIQNTVTQEISVGSSPSGNFIADEREASAGKKQEQSGSMPLRRSSRIRNQALSPPSAGRMLISSRG